MRTCARWSSGATGKATQMPDGRGPARGTPRPTNWVEPGGRCRHPAGAVFTPDAPSATTPRRMERGRLWSVVGQHSRSDDHQRMMVHRPVSAGVGDGTGNHTHVPAETVDSPWSFASSCAKLASRITGCSIRPRRNPSCGRRLDSSHRWADSRGVWRPWISGTGGLHVSDDR